jgi:hypothetical protein
MTTQCLETNKNTSSTTVAPFDENSKYTNEVQEEIDANCFMEMLNEQVTMAKQIDIQFLEKQIEIRKIDLLSPPHKPVIIFDLDETLILNEGSSIKTRPYFESVLSELSQLYELWIWSATDAVYVNAVVDILDPYRVYFSLLLDKTYCIWVGDKPVKDIRIFNNIDLSNIAIVDNYLFSFVGTLDNGILVQSFNGDDDDTELKQLLGLLLHLMHFSSIRIALKECINLEHYFI